MLACGWLTGETSPDLDENDSCLGGFVSGFLVSLAFLAVGSSSVFWPTRQDYYKNKEINHPYNNQFC